MSIVNSFSSGTTISSSAMNANFSDVASEITNSVAKDGQTSMTGPLRASSGTVSAPSMTFASDTDTGFYRKSSGTIGVVCDGTEVGTISSSGVSTGLQPFASGTKMLFVQTAAPTGWTKVTSYDNYALRIVSGTASSFAGATFTNVFGSRTLIEANLPVHTHTFSATTSSDGAHTHTVSNVFTSTTGSIVSSGGGTIGSFATPTTSSNGAHTHTVSGTTDSTGSATAIDFNVSYVDAIIATKD